MDRHNLADAMYFLYACRNRFLKPSNIFLHNTTDNGSRITLTQPTTQRRQSTRQQQMNNTTTRAFHTTPPTPTRDTPHPTTHATHHTHTSCAPSTLFNVSEAHHSFQHRHRPTPFQVARGLHRNALTNVYCMMRTCSSNKEWVTVCNDNT